SQYADGYGVEPPYFIFSEVQNHKQNRRSDNDIQNPDSIFYKEVIHVAALNEAVSISARVACLLSSVLIFSLMFNGNIHFGYNSISRENPTGKNYRARLTISKQNLFKLTIIWLKAGRQSAARKSPMTADRQLVPSVRVLYPCEVYYVIMPIK